jgi:hemerythrin-like domain-containing protein
MRRSAELTPLSHDHHRALFVALQLKRADDESASAGFLDFLDHQGEHHFRLEEQILLPGWLAADPDAEPEQAIRVLAEHLELRSAARALRSAAVGVETLHRLGELLERHVRFEEREPFPRIERALSATALADLGAELGRRE